MDFVHPVEAVIPGAQGRVLAVLVDTTAELNLRTIARLAGVSLAQASRVLPSWWNWAWSSGAKCHPHPNSGLSDRTSLLGP